MATWLGRRHGAYRPRHPGGARAVEMKTLRDAGRGSARQFAIAQGFKREELLTLDAARGGLGEMAEDGNIRPVSNIGESCCRVRRAARQSRQDRHAGDRCQG